MRFLFNPLQEHEQKLEKFRLSFCTLTSDGKYPYNRQFELYQICQSLGLDWGEARRAIQPDAVAFLRRTVEGIIADGKITAEEIADLRRLQQRLALPEEPVVPLLQQVYDLVERLITARIVEHAAYLSEADLIAILRQEITSYSLPPIHEHRLIQLLERQHHLAKLMVGKLPVIMPNVTLNKDEACHLDIPVRVLPGGGEEMISGQFVVTSERVMLLSPQGGFTATWAQCRALETGERSLVLVTSVQNAMIFCNDPLYVATLVAAARKVYTPAPPPEPMRAGRKLVLPSS